MLVSRSPVDRSVEVVMPLEPCLLMVVVVLLVWTRPFLYCLGVAGDAASSCVTSGDSPAENVG